MKYKVFVDGQEGTTGLKINERLKNREEIEILKIDPEKRKDIETRREFLNNADIVFLCLPDVASREAVSLIENNRTRVIDASTAFRIHPDWVYGLPEMSTSQRIMIENAYRVAVPGCHATGFNLAVYPLIQRQILPRDYPVTCQSITGYSGGGKKLIERYETDNADDTLNSPRLYALGLTHKHLPEMKSINGLKYNPLFTPVVGRFYRGMAVMIPLHTRLLNKKVNARDIQEILSTYYHNEAFVKVTPYGSDEYLDNGFFDALGCNDTNKCEIHVFGHDDQIVIVSRLDNLGKGASGAAVQNMNIMMGIDEGTGL